MHPKPEMVSHRFNGQTSLHGRFMKEYELSEQKGWYNRPLNGARGLR